MIGHTVETLLVLRSLLNPVGSSICYSSHGFVAPRPPFASRESSVPLAWRNLQVTVLSAYFCLSSFLLACRGCDNQSPPGTHGHRPARERSFRLLLHLSWGLVSLWVTLSLRNACFSSDTLFLARWRQPKTQASTCSPSRQPEPSGPTNRAPQRGPALPQCSCSSIWKHLTRQTLGTP